jgi:hypothetical protein
VDLLWKPSYVTRFVFVWTGPCRRLVPANLTFRKMVKLDPWCKLNSLCEESDDLRRFREK